MKDGGGRGYEIRIFRVANYSPSHPNHPSSLKREQSISQSIVSPDRYSPLNAKPTSVAQL